LITPSEIFWGYYPGAKCFKNQAELDEHRKLDEEKRVDDKKAKVDAHVAAGTDKTGAAPLTGTTSPDPKATAPTTGT